MNRQSILDLLNAEAPALRRKYAIQSLALFGSMARGDDREESDVDILVTFEGTGRLRPLHGAEARPGGTLRQAGGPAHPQVPPARDPGRDRSGGLPCPVGPSNGSPTSSSAARRSSGLPPGWTRISSPRTSAPPTRSCGTSKGASCSTGGADPAEGAECPGRLNLGVQPRLSWPSGTGSAAGRPRRSEGAIPCP